MESFKVRVPTLTQLYNDYIVYYDWLVDYVENYDLKTFNGMLDQPIEEYVRENPTTTVVGTILVGVVMGVVAYLLAHFSVYRHRHKAIAQIEPEKDEGEEADTQTWTNMMGKLHGGFNREAIGEIKKNIGRAKYKVTVDGEDSEREPLLGKNKKPSYDAPRVQELTDSSDDDGLDLIEEDEIPEEPTTIPKKKKVNFSDKISTSDDHEIFIDSRKLSDENILGTIGELHGKLKTAELRAKTRAIEKEMTQQQLDEESRMKQEQLESIFKLMMADQDKFGVSNKDDIAEQMKLYAI